MWKSGTYWPKKPKAMKQRVISSGSGWASPSVEGSRGGGQRDGAGAGDIERILAPAKRDADCRVRLRQGVGIHAEALVAEYQSAWERPVEGIDVDGVAGDFKGDGLAPASCRASIASVTCANARDATIFSAPIAEAATCGLSAGAV